jgi:type I site-specific restriction-modification system R (restriction) subunit
MFVFVDECHRTQSGKLHRVMKAIMPNAVFIGFTGTPLLKKDKQTSMEVFGGYIHTYKFGEAVADKVVLDLIYEARDIDQRLGSQEKIDAWFEAKTKSLNAWQKDELKSKWGTMQVVLSSKSRMGRVVSDIVFDFSVKPRLSSERGNAILIASSIHEACKYFTLFQKTPLKGKCAVVTSYNPLARDVTLEETGANTETDKQFIYNTYTNIADELDLAGYTAADIARIKHQQDAYLKLHEIIRMASGESLDLKAYEADMRHLIDTYIEADEPRTISDFGDISLLDLIVKTGMDKAIGSNLGGLKGDRNAIAETIENNVRSRIIKEQLNDPAYYERMSELLKEIIAARKSNAISYEKYLKKIADLVNQVHAGQPDDTPEPLKRSPALRAIYNNLGKSGDGTKLGDVELEPGGTGDRRLDLALRIDNTIRITRSDDWRGVQARELFIKQALFGILGDVDEVERLFLVIMQQREY